ncbi:unnamed protein product [Choristocarpus tenellus]
MPATPVPTSSLRGISAWGRSLPWNLRQTTGLVPSIARIDEVARGMRCASMTGGEDVNLPVVQKIDFRITEHAILRNDDPQTVSFVTGSNRGIGLEISRQLLSRTKGIVVAACRNPDQAEMLHHLHRLEGNKGRLDIVQMDVIDQSSIDEAAEHVKSQHKRLDLLFNVAGILGDGKTTPGPERSLKAIDRDWLQQTLLVNAIGPVMLTQAMAPLMLPGGGRRGGGHQGPTAPSVVINFSARVGSVTDNHLGGWHSYRMSKAMLNMWTKGLSLELRRKGVWAISYHPGTTDTGLSEPFQKNVRPEKLFTPAYTVGKLLDLVNSLEEEHSGGFYDFDGIRIPW